MLLHDAGLGSVFLPALILLALERVDADLLVILLKSSEILSRLTELSLLHPFSDIPSKYYCRYR